MKSGEDEERLEYRTRIKDWPSEERPREKLLLHGAHSLSEAELLAILIREGTRSANVLDVAKSIISDRRSLRSIARMTASELMRLKGIGQAKAITLLAAFEIGRRIQSSESEPKAFIRTPEDVARRMVPRLRDLTREEFVVLLLDSQNALQREEHVTVGTLNSSVVHPREVFKPAIDFKAASVIVVHNHPSGNKEPSHEDIEITKQLVEAGKILGIPLHDHVIVAGEAYTSFADRGLI